MKGTVSLHGLEFHAYHGVYPHERSSGNKFEVDIHVETVFNKSVLEDDLTATLDYEQLYKVIKTEMEKPSKLLETVAYAIADKILATFPESLAVELHISKFNPPIGGVCKKATVTVQRGRG